ncbi:hypothetical protein QNK01_04265 [Desemzia incerta]|uniref:hypothetical protein n=1 Tax=Desemzia incerta TaxID=82801 RepID=UPI0024C42317|nr:hypothetical protein [Desemzia incerta]WHZ32827.1 hypothetical protein QNK01_04265 [Desemzia incerta]
MKRKKLWILLSVLIIGLFLPACSNDEAFNDEWHSTAEEEGILLQATEPVTLMFSEQGMQTDYDYWDSANIIDFPFENGKVYENYEVSRKDDTITIEVDEKIHYELTVLGNRLFRDEVNALLFKTDDAFLDLEPIEE